MNYKYGYLNINIKSIENINNALNSEIDSLSDYLEDIKNLEECKSALLDFMLIARVQMNLLNVSIEDIKNFNKDFILNSNKKPSEHIKPLMDNEFKKQLIAFKY